MLIFLALALLAPARPANVIVSSGSVTWQQPSGATEVCVTSYSADWLTWYGRQCLHATEGPMRAELKPGAHWVFLEEWDRSSKPVRWLGEWGPFAPASVHHVWLPIIRR